jgi:hypothetical protein
MKTDLLNNDLTHLFNDLQGEVHNFVGKNKFRIVTQQHPVALCILTLRSISLPSLCIFVSVLQNCTCVGLTGHHQIKQNSGFLQPKILYISLWPVRPKHVQFCNIETKMHKDGKEWEHKVRIH